MENPMPLENENKVVNDIRDEPVNEIVAEPVEEITQESIDQDVLMFLMNVYKKN